MSAGVRISAREQVGAGVGGEHVTTPLHTQCVYVCVWIGYVSTCVYVRGQSQVLLKTILLLLFAGNGDVSL